MATPLARRPEADGASPQVVPAGSGTAEYAVPASLRGIGAQAAGVLGLLTGVWVALSPPILEQKHSIAHAMYWSNSFSAGVLIALAAAGLGFAALRRTAH
jgi:hypothetical protein